MTIPVPLGSLSQKLICVQALFHNYVADIKDEMFEGAADVILGRLANAAEAVGKALGDALQELADKVRLCREVNCVI